MTGLLANKKCYLSGPIEFDASGLDWRPEVKNALLNKFKINVFDPFCDPKQSKSTELKKAKELQDYDQMRKITFEFVRKDLKQVDKSDLLIANLPYLVPTVGTIHEIISAHESKIPTLLVCEKGKTYIPSWFYGFIKHKYMFGSWSELYHYLDEVDKGKHLDDHRWLFITDLV